MNPEFVDLEPTPIDPNDINEDSTSDGNSKATERKADVAKIQKVLPDLRKNTLTNRLEYGSRTSPTIIQGDDLQTMTVKLSVENDMYIPEARLERALRWIATENSYCPIKRYLMDCMMADEEFPHWDNLSGWFLGNEDQFATSVLQRFLIGAVARAYEPGCTMDWMPILIGKQGCGKSQLARELCPRTLYSEFTLPMDVLMKEMYRLHVAWIIELPEVDNFFKRQNIENFKNVLSVTEDVVRKPYASETTDLKRQVVMLGTSNRSEFLIDETGNRRFIPLEIADGYETPWKELIRLRNSMWKRAVQQYRKGDQWFIRMDEVENMADYLHNFAQVDPWEPLVAQFVQNVEETTVTDVLVKGLSFHPQMIKRSESSRVSSILTAMGWRRQCTSRNGVSIRLWKRSAPTKRRHLNDF